MSSYDKVVGINMSPTDKPAEASQPRIEAPAHLGSRQQLPSLSSLFGPPSAVRPLPSPRADQSASFPSPSPLYPPRGPPGSYFPQTSPSFAEPRTAYASKPDDRHALGQLVPSFSGPSSPSPRFMDQSASRSDSRSETGSTGRGYRLASRDPMEHSPQESLHHMPFPGARDHRLHGYPEHRPGHGGPNMPPTPTSTDVSDAVTVKDGLGPKIWTGTHFLPRFVRAVEIPGEGLCYQYDDGSHCKTVIDGEAVNAHWGVTKAGKPRKRLAIACITCREKKIKCDPDFPRCVQCEKFGRVCKFKNAPRGGHNLSPSTPPAELDDVRKLGGETPRMGGASLPRSDVGSPISPRVALRHPPPETGPSKRQRLETGVYNPHGDHLATVPRSPEQCKSQIAIQRPAPELPRLSDEVLSRAWRTDPYVSDPQSISAVVSQFFDHVENTTIMRFVPEDTFKTWLANTAHKKTPEELMLVYSMLAVGVLLSGGPKHIASEYAQVAQYAQGRPGPNVLHLAQSRILLALYYTLGARRCEANDMISGAAGVTACLQLNMELESSRESGLTVYPFGLTKAGYSECRRRTFWSLFMLERLCGMFPDRLLLLHTDDTYLRLPADVQVFESQLESRMPFFDPHESQLPAMPKQHHGTTAYLVEMVHVWARCEHAIYRMSRRSQASREDMNTMQGVLSSLDKWQRTLPQSLVWSSMNMTEADKNGCIASFFMMHLLFSHAMIKAHRHPHSSNQLSENKRADLLHQCGSHAKRIMDIGVYIEHVLRTRTTALAMPPPTTATVLAEAMDVLSARGAVSRISELIRDGQMVEALADQNGAVWAESLGAKEAITERLSKLNQIRDQKTAPSGPLTGSQLVGQRNEPESQQWVFEEAMARSIPTGNMDIVYMAHD
jgi:hypothetical protein